MIDTIEAHNMQVDVIKEMENRLAVAERRLRQARKMLMAVSNDFSRLKHPDCRIVAISIRAWLAENTETGGRTVQQ
jgi:hypothetical protein